MRLATTALMLAAFALTACSGTTTGTGTGSLPGAGSGSGSGFALDDGGACEEPCDTSGFVSDAGTKKPPTATSSEYDVLFDAPASTTVTPNSLDGRWAGSMSNTDDDVRVVITPSALTIAVRCNSGHPIGAIPTTTVGLTVSAVTSSVSIRTLESKSAGTTTCRISIHPQTMSRCSTGSGSPTCFDLTDTGLDFGPNRLFSGDGTSSSGPYPAFSKLSDGT
ncbi:MAG: hypothetical protein QOI41_5716 [Myxococcales bacterium]|jgi:hypothetical protein|nr:hypothetical protein [Myxococcales bacterium]